MKLYCICIHDDVETETEEVKPQKCPLCGRILYPCEYCKCYDKDYGDCSPSRKDCIFRKKYEDLTSEDKCNIKKAYGELDPMWADGYTYRHLASQLLISYDTLIKVIEE